MVYGWSKRRLQEEKLAQANIDGTSGRCIPLFAALELCRKDFGGRPKDRRFPAHGDITRGIRARFSHIPKPGPRTCRIPIGVAMG
jgi:hypothetical protein